MKIKKQEFSNKNTSTFGNVSVKPKDIPIQDRYSNHAFNQEDSKEEEKEDLGKNDVNEDDAGKDGEDFPIYFQKNYY